MGYIQEEHHRIIESKRLFHRDLVLVYVDGDKCNYQIWSQDYDFRYGAFRATNKEDAEDMAVRIKMAWDNGRAIGFGAGADSVRIALKNILEIKGENL